jgi:soluble lytic murein transglycosylase-like protein
MVYLDTNQISKLIQAYSLKSINSSSESSDSTTSLLFELLLQSLEESGAEQGSISRQDSSGYSPSNSKGARSVNQSGDISGDILNAIELSSRKYGEDDSLIESVIEQESDFNPDAVSSAGAQGLMQLMPGTARSLGVDNPFDVLENIDGGTRYIKTLLDAFNGDKKLALAAYNGGIGRMNKLGVDTDEEISKMPSETQNYVTRVLRNYEKYKSDIK